MDMVMSLGKQMPVVIFSKSNCDMCYSIKTLISGFGARLTVHELDQIPNGQQMERALVSMGRKPSVPAVFIGEEFIGGESEVMSLHLQGRLKQKLKAARAIHV